MRPLCFYTASLTGLSEMTLYFRHVGSLLLVMRHAIHDTDTTRHRPRAA